MDNIKPDKSKTRHRIDGVVAAVMAIGRATVSAAAGQKRSIYEDRGMLIL